MTSPCDAGRAGETIEDGARTRAIPRYGFAGFRDTMLAKALGAWWLAAAVVSMVIPDLLGTARFRVFAGIALTVLSAKISQGSVSLRRVMKRASDGSEDVSGDERAEAFALLIAWAAVLSLAGWLIVSATEDSALANAQLLASWIARIAGPLCVASASAAMRKDRIARLMVAPDVWNMADDSGYHSRRMTARFIDVAIVGVATACVIMTGWWAGAVPRWGPAGAPEFMTFVVLLLAYDIVCGYAGRSLGKQVRGLRTRRVPGVRNWRGVTAPVVRSAALVGVPGIWVVWWAQMVEWTDAGTIEVFAGAVLAGALLSSHWHGEAQGIHDALAGSVVVRRIESRRFAGFWPSRTS